MKTKIRPHDATSAARLELAAALRSIVECGDSPQVCRDLAHAVASLLGPIVDGNGTAICGGLWAAEKAIIRLRGLQVDGDGICLAAETLLEAVLGDAVERLVRPTAYGTSKGK